MFICKVCGGVVEQGMAFCPTCGADVVQNYEVVCPTCGTKNGAGSRFCAHCGNMLETMRKPRCSVCGYENLPGSKFCVVCGAPIVNERDTAASAELLSVQKAKRTFDVQQKERIDAVDKEVADKKAKLNAVKEAALKEVAEKVSTADAELNKKAALLDEYRRKLNELGPEDVALLKKLSLALKTNASYYADPYSTVDEDEIEGETYVCPACGTINPADVPACTHCGRSKARSIVLLKKDKIKQAKAVKRQNRVLKAPETDVEPEPSPTFDEYAEGRFEDVKVEITSPETENEEEETEQENTPNLGRFVPGMPYGMPGKPVGGTISGYNYPPYGAPNMGGGAGQPYQGGYGQGAPAFFNQQTGEPYQMPPILQPVAFVPYVTQEQPLIQYTPSDPYAQPSQPKQKPVVAQTQEQAFGNQQKKK